MHLNLFIPENSIAFDRADNYSTQKRDKCFAGKFLYL